MADGGVADGCGDTWATEGAMSDAGVQQQRTAVTVGLGPRAAARLAEALPGWQVEVAGSGAAGDAPPALAVLSSRLEPDAAAEALRDLLGCVDGPIVVVTHPGGEAATVDLLAQGATLALPEGRENRVAGLFADAVVASELVDAYVTWAGSSAPRRLARHVDEHAGLPGALAFEDALAEAAAAPLPPRVVVLSARDLGTALSQMHSGVANLLRRRIAQQVQNAVQPLGVRVHALDTVRFAMLLPGDEAGLDAAVEPLRLAVESWAPVQGRALRLGLGHAGPDDADDVAVLRDLAERACDVAVETGRRVVSAAELVEAVADRTNLVTLLGAVEALERQQPALLGHAARVADLAAALAVQLALEPVDRGRLATAARFHDVGLLGLPPELVAADPDDLAGEDLATWRTHVDRGASALAPVAGTMVAAIVRHHHEHVDGSGFPDGLMGDRIPLASRVVAVADAFDRLLLTAPEGADLDEAVARLAAESGTRWDRTVVDALVDLVRQRRLPHALTA